MNLQPETNPADAERVAVYLRGLTDAQLIQATSSPRSLVGALEGFTLNHLRTAAQDTVVALACEERSRRTNERIDRRSRNAFWVSIASLGIAVLTLVASFGSWRLPALLH